MRRLCTYASVRADHIMHPSNVLKAMTIGNLNACITNNNHLRGTLQISVRINVQSKGTKRLVTLNVKRRKSSTTQIR